MSVLAKANGRALELAYGDLAEPPSHERLRGPETGMVMVRGRAGGSGDPFNLGEMTVTRCTVRLADGQVGHGYVAGRDKRHAELAALFDALLQDPARRPSLTRSLIEPLLATQAAILAERARKAAATKVEFFTMVRGES
ncbi:MAG: phosphonate C-P lyase system protein PhnG [Alphaproteobacteria bacterium]|nr:phosphonate C-P lyase system protein PhnG [Alphaproteobacteria bacterium]